MEEDMVPRTESERTTIIAPRRLFEPGEEAYRYKLEAPTFTGVEDVEQFISEFNETLAISQWPPRVALIKLWGGALTEQAKPYRQRSNINRVFVALRDSFGISAIDARSRLQRLFRKKNTPLQDHATVVKRLAQIAYSDLPETQQQHYILDNFTQSLNNIGLHHQLQAKGFTTIKAALQEGKAYFQAQRLYQVTQTSQQVTTEPNHLNKAATTNISPSLESRPPVDHAEMSDDYSNLYQTYGYSTESFQTNHFMLGVWQTRTPALGLSTNPTTRLPQTAQTSKTREPGKEKFRGRFRKASERTPRTHPVSGRSPAGLADQIGDGNHSHCLSRTASASYRKRSWLARSIRTSDGNPSPLSLGSLIFRGPSNHAPNGHRPAWSRPSMLGK